MDLNAIYVVITTHLFVSAPLKRLFTEALQKHPNLEVHAGPMPGLATFVDDPYDREVMEFVFSEHMASKPLRMDPSHEELRNRVMPGVPDAPLGHQILIAVIGAGHSGKTSVIRELEAALLADQIPADHIRRFTLDHPTLDINLSAEDNAKCISEMRARKIVLLFQKPRRQSDLTELFIRCGAEPRPVEPS